MHVCAYVSKRSSSSDSSQPRSKRLSYAEAKRMILQSNEESSASHWSDLETESDDSDATDLYDASSADASIADPGVAAGDPGANTGDTWSKLYGSLSDCTFQIPLRYPAR